MESTSLGLDSVAWQLHGTSWVRARHALDVVRSRADGEDLTLLRSVAETSEERWEMILELAAQTRERCGGLILHLQSSYSHLRLPIPVVAQPAVTTGQKRV